MLYYMIGDYMTFEVFVNELKMLNPNVKIEVVSDGNKDGIKKIISSVSVMDLVLPKGFYCYGDTITNMSNSLDDEVIIVEVKVNDYVDNNYDELLFEKNNYTPKEINSLLFSYLNNINYFNVLSFEVETSEILLTKLYMLYKSLINTLENSKVKTLKELEDKVYTINGVRLSEMNCIRYELSQLSNNMLNVRNNSFKKDIEKLMFEIESILSEMSNGYLIKTDKKSSMLSDLKKKLVILQILTGRKVTFFESSCELLLDYCEKINYEKSNSLFK